MDILEISNLRKSGADALRRGDARTARDSFERLLKVGQADVNIYIALAVACGHLADLPHAHAAADKALELDSRNLRALILKGDLLAHEGDARSASSYYLTAVQSAPPPNEMPAELRGDLERANAMC